MGERTIYYAVFGTGRSDLSESVVALLSTEALARDVSCRLVAQRGWLVRCRVRRVFLTFEETARIVGQWGREDAIRGQSVTHADKIMPPFREVYLAGYQSATGTTDG